MLALALVGAWGCNSSRLLGPGYPSATQADYGRSVAHNSVEMMVNPPHGRADGQPVGLSPDVAQNVQKSYTDSFDKTKAKEQRPRSILLERLQ